MLFEMEEYVANEQTMALLSINHKQYRTKVLELNDEFMINSSPLNVIDTSCLKYGLSYEGRRNAAKRLANLHFKAPVAIAPHKTIYAFPTHSSR